MDHNILPEHIRANLKQYESHHKCTCLECGYQGHMGIKQTVIPWWATWWTFLVGLIVILTVSVFNIFISLIYGFIWGLLRRNNTGAILCCPNCKNDLEI